MDKSALRVKVNTPNCCAMTKAKEKEARLAAALRENLRKRKSGQPRPPREGEHAAQEES